MRSWPFSTAIGCRVADGPPSLPHPTRPGPPDARINISLSAAPLVTARCLGGDGQALFVCGQDVVVDAGNRALVLDLGVPCSRTYLLPRSHPAEGWVRRSIDAESGRESHHLHVCLTRSAGGDDEPDIRALAARDVECPGHRQSGDSPARTARSRRWCQQETAQTIEATSPRMTCSPSSIFIRSLIGRGSVLRSTSKTVYRRSSAVRWVAIRARRFR